MAAEPLQLTRKQFDDVPFGRNRMLALLGTGLVGFSLRLARAEPAEANHGAPYPCYGFHECSSCVGSYCPDCYWYDHSHCPSGGQCWYACYCTAYFHCCDWHTYDPYWPHCICRGHVGSCGGGC